MSASKVKRVCTSCGKAKPLSKYGKAERYLLGRKRRCRECETVYRRTWRKNNPVKNAFYMLRSTAKLQDLECTISSSSFCVLVNQPCSYCQIVYNPMRHAGSYWLDRIDNQQGYTLDNVLPACGVCNRLRNSEFTVQETKIMVGALLEYRKQTND